MDVGGKNVHWRTREGIAFAGECLLSRGNVLMRLASPKETNCQAHIAQGAALASRQQAKRGDGHNFRKCNYILQVSWQRKITRSPYTDSQSYSGIHPHFNTDKLLL